MSSHPKLHPIRDTVVGFGLFLCVLIVHVNSLYAVSSDSRWSLPVALSIINRGDTNLDEYREMLAREPRASVDEADGHHYNFYPIGTALISLPFVWVDQLFTREADIIAQREYHERRIASVFVALTTVLLYFIARGRLDRTRAVLLALVFAFCTSAWSTASRGLWQHGPSMLVLTLVLGIVPLARRYPRLIVAAGPLLAFSYVIRPTNSLIILFFSAYVLIAHRRYFIPYVLCAIPVGAALLVYNVSVYHQPLSPYYRLKVGSGRNYLEGIVGVLVSPGRGLFVYSPVFLFSLYGVWLKLRDRSFDLLDGGLCAVAGLTTVVVGTFVSWWGGHSYGCRLLTDLSPFLVYFMIPVFARGLRPVGATLFILLAGVSFAIHCHGANSLPANVWNSLVPNVDTSTERLWSWRYPAFLVGWTEMPRSTGFPRAPLDTRIDLRTPEALPYLGGEWIDAGTIDRWTTTGRADVCFTLEQPRALTLKMLVRAPCPPGQTYRLAISINDGVPQTVTFTDGEFQFVRIPLSPQTLGTRNTVSFRFPDTPSRLWLRSGTRQFPWLGMGVQWFELSTDPDLYPKIPFGTEVDLTQPNNKYLVTGWGDVTDAGREIAGSSAVVQFSVKTVGPLRLKLFLTPLASPREKPGNGEKTRFQVGLNGVDLPVVYLTGVERRVLEFDLPPTATQPDNTMTLRFPDLPPNDRKTVLAAIRWMSLEPATTTPRQP